MAKRLPSLLDALLPKLRQRILATFYLQPTRAWTSSELAKHLAVTPSSLSRELANFESFDILKVESIGRMKRYSANQENVVFSELQNLVNKTVGVVGQVKAMLQPFSKSIDVAFIYGSTASGEANFQSDIDLMVIGSLELKALSRALPSLEQTLLRPVNPTLYSRDDWDKSLKNNSNFIETVMKEKKIFLIGDEDDLV